MGISVPRDEYRQVIDVLVSEKRDLVTTHRFFTRALEHGPRACEVSTDRAPTYPRVLDELVPAACHVTAQYGRMKLSTVSTLLGGVCSWIHSFRPAAAV